VKSNQIIGAENVAVTESPSLSTCTIHIERRGGRGDAGARALERHLERLSGVHDVDVSFRTGDARITYDASVTSEESIRDVIRDRNVSIQEASETTTDDAGTRSELRREAVFVGLTLLGMVTGLATGWLDGPGLLMWAGYGVAYIFGGWYGLKGAIETLRHRAVDIDLLMIVAALGALSIGAPFEGAMLLFLFSLSNTLQHYAIGRISTRDLIARRERPMA
jgi:Cd2+/Zn2+-exporting ATPase